MCCKIKQRNGKLDHLFPNRDTVALKDGCGVAEPRGFLGERIGQL